MTKVLTLCLMVVCSMKALASTIDWNYFSLYQDGSSVYLDRGQAASVDPDFRFSPYVIFDVSAVEGWYRLESSSLEQTASSFVGNWLLAQPGDLVDASATRFQGEYFNHCKLDSETAIDVPIEVADNTSFYLMFVVADPNDSQLSPDLLYGWVELSVMTNGRVALEASALGLDGQSMVVGGGAVPEPSTTLLLMIGCAGLALRRRRGCTK